MTTGVSIRGTGLTGGGTMARTINGGGDGITCKWYSSR